MFSFERFTELAKFKGIAAAEKYRDSFKKTPTKEVETKEETTPDIVSVDELTIDDMKKILDNAGVTYSHLAKEKGLMKLLKENELT